jgi:hypothetical protein
MTGDPLQEFLDYPRSVNVVLVTSAAFLSRHPSVANYFTVELAVLKEMTQELAELFCLTIPVSWKKQTHFSSQL